MSLHVETVNSICMNHSSHITGELRKCIEIVALSSGVSDHQWLAVMDVTCVLCFSTHTHSLYI